MGDKMGLVMNGVPNSENILKLVEASSKSSDSLQKNFDIFDVCNNKNGAI
jgi:hypothetical protein